MLPRLAALNLLQRGFHIRAARENDLPIIAALTRAQERRHAGALGAPHYPSLRKAIAEARLHVGVLEGVGVVGHVEYYRRQDGWQTIYSLAVDPRYEGLSIGRNLLYSVECPIRLKCPQAVNGGDANPANAFYQRMGLCLTGTDATRKGKALNVWTLPILPVLVQGNNREMPRIARESGWAYGTRDAEKPRDWCYQVDLEFSEDWRAFDWQSYIAHIQAWKPFAALALDYFEKAQLPTLLQQISDLKAAGVMRVLVCPKFDGAVQDIPADCIVALSVPSSYAGFVPDFNELKGRKVHLLGGSPPKWFGSRRKSSSATGWISGLQGAGAQVISVDGNAHTGAAEQGGIWKSGVWDFKERPLNLYRFMTLSGRNILTDLHHSSRHEQLSLFAS